LQRVKKVFGDGTSALFFGYGMTAILRLGSNMILTRLLAPEVFGLSVIITSALFVFQMLTDIGTGSFIIRHPTADERVFRTLWTVKLVRGVMLFLVTFAAAPLVAAAYNAPELVAAIRVSAIVFVINGASSMAHLIGARDRRILRMSAIDFLAFVTSTILTIILAYYLRTYWAFVFSAVFSSCLSLIFSYTLYPKFNVGFSWDKGARKEIWDFSKYVLPSSFITIFLSEFDKFVMANSFPKEELGFYMLAAGLLAAVSQLNSKYTSRVFSPKFAHAARTAPETMKAAYYSLRLRFMLVMTFLFGGLMGSGDFIAQVLFDDRYLRTGFYIALVAFGKFAGLFQGASNAALVNLGYIRATMVASIVRMVWMVVATPVGYILYGPIGMIIAIHLSWWVLMFFQMWRLRQAGVFVARQEVLPFISGAAGLGIGLGVNWLGYKLMEIGWLPQF
jgi:O-antigen/teichoic acid export membrane protein